MTRHVQARCEEEASERRASDRREATNSKSTESSVSVEEVDESHGEAEGSNVGGCALSYACKLPQHARGALS